MATLIVLVIVALTCQTEDIVSPKGMPKTRVKRHFQGGYYDRFVQT